MDAVKDTLHRALRDQRAGLLSRLDGLAEVDLRRPLTPSGTNLLGLVKHLAGVEYGYLGDSFERPPAQPLPWFADGSVWQNADMWATPDEGSDYILGVYRDACEHSDRTIAELDLATPGRVPWWDEERQEREAPTLGTLVVRVLLDTARHAGQADIIRELVDGLGGEDRDLAGDEQWWKAYVARVAEAAAAFED